MTDADDLSRQREDMVFRHLQRRGIRSSRVLDAMRRVPRESFLPPALRRDAYADAALPIDCEQTISQPYIVALMSEALELTGSERVLEIGTGSGYQTAVLAELAAEVVSIERHAQLHEQAGNSLAALGYKNVTLRLGDGARGWPASAPYDRAILTAASEQCPPPLWEQLAEGGLLVGPFGARHEQMLQAIRKRGGQPEVVELAVCRFVPLVLG